MAKIHSTSYASDYSNMRAQSCAMNENNDCAVVALAIVCNVSYAVAHAELKKLGRKDRKGTFFHHTAQAVKNLGKSLQYVSARSFIDTYPGVHKNLKHVTTHHPRRFNKCFDPSKTYLFQTRRHILAVKNGETKDWTVNKAKQVVAIHEVF